MDLKITILICIFCFLFVKCIIPSLSVRKVDSKLIERKRQDTLEICRIFNEADNRNLIANSTNVNIDNYNKKNRSKRDVDNNELGNPTLKQQDIIRVEKIVDKLYDDLDPTGNPVTYRRRELSELTEAKNLTLNANRRFNFAPAQLLGPLPEKENSSQKPLQGESVDIPWIKKWKHGVVPFFIDSNTYDAFLAEIILKAFDYIEKATCIRLQRLRERPTDKQSMQNVEWLYITNPSGIRQCVHTNERRPNTGVQMVVFGYDCLSQGEIAHEVMHILGFSHEHTRPDRDRYISILWDNIKPGYKKYFEVRKEDPLSNLPYDYASVLHYPPRAFSKNGQVTVMTESGSKIGQRDAFSEIDVEKIRTIYGHECIERNEIYLRKTCGAAAMFSRFPPRRATKEGIKKYFEDRIWPYGIINYKIKDALEFSAEERDNIKAVINHIEKETCIEFRDITDEDKDGSDKDDNDKDDNDNGNKTAQKNEDKSLNEPDTESEEIERAEDDNMIVNEDIINENITLPDGGVFSQPKEIHSDSKNISVVLYPNKLKLTMKFPKLTTKYYDNIKNKTDTSNNTILRYGKTKQLKKVQHSKLKKDISNKEVIKESKKVRIPLPLSSRRHAANVIMLKRSTNPGCKCPSPGRPNGDKILTINADCFNSVNDLLHLFVHVLGLDHQHNMHDRERYLKIVWDNITPEIKKELSTILPPEASAGFGYDYQSVMHYPWLQIKDGVTNIMYPVWNDGWAMGHWQGLSWTDVQKIEHIYEEQCEKRRQEMQKE